MASMCISETANLALPIEKTFNQGHDIQGKYDPQVEVSQEINTPTKSRKEEIIQHPQEAENSKIGQEFHMETKK